MEGDREDKLCYFKLETFLLLGTDEVIELKFK